MGFNRDFGYALPRVELIRNMSKFVTMCSEIRAIKQNMVL